jgi:tetratricopeptide (TPR) repeat protein
MNVDQAVALAHRHFDAGQLDRAELLCRQALAAWPGRADALHLLGLMAHGSRNHQTAIDYLTEACKAPRAPALYFSNLAEMHRARGNLAAAEEAGRRAVERDANLAQAWNNLGITLQEAGKFEESLVCLERAAALAPGNAEILNNLGNTHARLGQLDQAWGHYMQALDLNPAYAEAHSNLASVLHALGRAEEALDHAGQAIEHNPQLVDAYINAASVLLGRGAYNLALQRLDGLLAFSPGNLRGLLLYAQVLEAAGRGADALAVCRRAVKLSPKDGEAQLTLAKLLQAQGQPAAAMVAVQLAVALLRDPAEALAVQSGLLVEAGDAAGALAACDAALAANPRLATAWLSRSELQKHARGAPQIAAMEALLAPGGVQGFTEQICLHFALGKAYLDHDDAARGFAHLHVGNRMKRAEINFDLARTVGWMGEIARAFPAREAEGEAGANSVFVIGMPRSGTTLMEQILASHGQVHGAGELNFGQAMVDGLSLATGRPYPDFAAVLNPGRLREAGEGYEARLRAVSTAALVVDKMPSNFLHAGVLHLALPQARMIHVRRDAADTCFSCYTKLFAGPQAFAYDLRELGGFYQGYEGLMAHWRQVLPADRFIEVEYEALVADFEPQARRLLDFCGLDWDEACLRFFATPRAVRTASAAQVRQPIYASSIGRARRYAAQLAPLFEAL